MTRSLTRRAALRSGLGVALATSLAGCGHDDEEAAAASPASTSAQTSTPTPTPTPTDSADESPDIPAVEDGAVIDARRLAIAHEETLQKRSGRLVGTTTFKNVDDATVVRSTAKRVDVDGDRIHSVTVGSDTPLPNGVERRDVYIEDDDRFVRTLTEDEWRSERIRKGSQAGRPPNLTGRSRLEALLGGLRLVGREPTADDERYLFRRSESSDEAETEWFRTEVSVEPSGLCHEWSQVIDERRSETLHRLNSDTRLEGLLETVVSRPAWVDDVEE